MIAGILVVLIIFVFLATSGARIIPALAIPTSIIAAFGVMYFLGFTINNLTLLALILVDRDRRRRCHHRDGERLPAQESWARLHEAAMRGTNEIALRGHRHDRDPGGRLLAARLPRGTTGGCSTSSASRWPWPWSSPSFVALTLTPMLCAKILRVPKSHGRLFNCFERAFFGSPIAGTRRAWRGRSAPSATWSCGPLPPCFWPSSSSRHSKREFVPPRTRGTS